MKALFFGMKNCIHSELAYKYLTETGWTVTPVWSSFRNEPLPECVDTWSGEYIFSFRSYFFLKPKTLNKASVSAINFHPSNPKYPGSGSASWALYNADTVFGVTAHIMNEKIDNGCIIDVLEFPIYQEDNLSTLTARTKDKLYDIFRKVVFNIISDDSYLINALNMSTYVWNGTAKTIGDIDRLQNIPINVETNELDSIVRATTPSKYMPFIMLHGRKFVLTSEPTIK